jgi:Neisseria PilC beta-propeller domain
MPTKTQRLPPTLKVGIIIGATIGVFATFFLVWSGAALARVSPLSIIARQIHDPNMLVVLDTSGSLTGVPGGSFSSSSEVGVDCDDGVNCRGGTASGTCDKTAKVCSSDAQCRSLTCKLDGLSCLLNSDCQPQAGKCILKTCNSSGGNCQYAACFLNGDCPLATSGNCASTTSACSPTQTCSSKPRCQYGGATCSLGQSCAAYGHCLNSLNQLTSQTCSQSSSCPLKSTGTCSVGGQVCTSVATCLSKLCPDHTTVCTADSQCGLCSYGSSSKGTYCTKNSDCNSGGASCKTSGGACSVNNNKCNIPNYTCQIEQAQNPCLETNACVGPANTCVAGPANPCMAGTSSDVCNFANNSTSAIGMCRMTLLKCQDDGDCPVTGDNCGPATSRVVIAKRVLADIVNNNNGIVNFGFMTFYQSLYFPYYKQASTGTQTATLFYSRGRLEGRGCFSATTGPTQTCVIDGITYSLVATNSSRYTIRGNGGQLVYNTWCGATCNIATLGTGNYQGSTYSYTLKTGTTSGSAVVKTGYTGKQMSSGGQDYRYYDSNPSYYNSGATPPIEIPQCGLVCSAKCGARWDTQLAPFLDPTGNAVKTTAMALAISDRLAPASYGGLISYGGTPTGCALRNDLAPSSGSSAYDYMNAVKSIDALSCRENFVLLITDGEANGPGDTACDSSACAATNPRAAGCLCRAVLSAYDMRQNLGVRTFVVGFSGDVSAGVGRVVNDNIAKAGGTDRGNDAKAPYAFIATSESELSSAIQDAIYDAVKGSYATSPPTMSSGLQQANGVTSGSYALDSRADFPSWKGHLLAYDTSATPPTLVWDAAAELGNVDWKTRRIYTSDASNNLVQIVIDASGNITNKASLFALGLGGNATEAALIARWLLGDPAQGNAAVFGALVNSTPIDVGQPGDSPLPGGHAFYTQYKNRARLTYVGADDGLLHALWSQDQTVGGIAHRGGSEAFAYLPPEMLPVVTRLYAQGGQLPDPAQHVYGLASSPKVKNLCVSNCSAQDTAVWKTELVMTDGFGGTEAFALDISDPTANPPIKVMWTTNTSSSKATYDVALGQTIAVPGFYFNKTTAMDDQRLLFGSGYRVDTTSSGLGQGLSMLSVAATTGVIQTRAQVSPPGGSCGQEYTILTDVATARDYARNASTGIDEKQKLLGAYSGDTWGNLWRFNGGVTPRLVSSMGCNHPLHFAPTVVQLDRDDPTNHPHEIYLVQVTNSTLDDATQGFEPSRMVFMRELADVDGNVTSDSSFGTNGQIVLTVGDAPRMCAMTDASGGDCLMDMPDSARPMSTPLAVLKQDGSGFLVLSTWYVPAASGCGKGATYMQIHQYSGGQAILKQALKVGDEPVSAPIVVGGKIMVMSSAGPVVISGSVLQNFVVGTSTAANNGVGAEPFKILGWSEL